MLLLIPPHYYMFLKFCMCVFCVTVNQEHDAVRLLDRRGCSDCGHPMADKMADFALETQGEKLCQQHSVTGSLIL